MKVDVKKGSPSAYRGEAIVVCHFEDSRKLGGAALQLERSSGGLLGEVIKSGDFTGKHAQVSVIYTRGALPVRRIVLLGLGKKKDFDPEKLRRAFSKAGRAIRDLGVPGFAASLDSVDGPRSLEDLTEAAVEGVLLGLYEFKHFKTADKKEERKVKTFTILAAGDGEARRMKAAAQGPKSFRRPSGTPGISYRRPPTR